MGLINCTLFLRTHSVGLLDLNLINEHGRPAMKRKGLYLAFDDFNFDAFSDASKFNGIQKKIYLQIKTFEEYGFEMDFYNPYLCRRHSTERFLRRMPLQFLRKWDFDFTTISQYDFIYIRKAWFMDGDLIMALKKIKEHKPNVKVLLEIPTFPYDDEGKKIDIIPLLIKDKLWRKHLFKYVDRIVTYSNDNEIFGIKTLITSNAIDYERVKRNKILNDVDSTIKIIACASLYYWHGYDRAIEGIKEYYKKPREKEIVLYIVGDGAEYATYHDLIKKYSLEEHIILTGSQFGHDLDEIYNNCIIGLDSMGRHRSNVYYNSSLKGKEYCAKGLIIVSGVETELDNSKDFDYYYRVPADDSALDFCSIIDFALSKVEREGITNIQKNIMRYAKEHFDFSIAMDTIRQFIES